MSEGRDGSGYWYEAGSRVTSVEVLNLMRRYRAAESAMRQRTRDAMRMGETDLLALRHLMKAGREGRMLRGRDLADLLGISSASVTILVDRLEAGGHVRRDRHPTDRRATVITATSDTDAEVRQTLGAMHQRMIATADRLGDDELVAVQRFLLGMIDAVTTVEDLDQELADAVEEHRLRRED